MKVKVNGNVMSVISDINFYELKKLTATESVVVKDADGNIVYGVKTGLEANINDISAIFTHPTSEGKAAFNIAIPLDLEDTEEFIIKNYGRRLANLQANEEKIAAEMVARKNAIEAMKSVITVE